MLRRALRPVVDWLFDRLGLDAAATFMREHKVPGDLGTRRGWAYVFGLSTAMTFGLQVVTGIGLVTAYIPSPGEAYGSLVALTNETVWGALLRGMHYYGASAMVLLISIHMARVYLTASYKYPREINWMTGVVLFGLTMAMALTGQLLRWDENGVWTVVVVAQFVARVPVIGPWLGEFVIGGPTLSGVTLSRFYAVHVLILPLAIAGLVALHVMLVIRHGISEWPRSGKPVDKATYRPLYEEEKKRSGLRYFPDVAWREIVVGACALAAVMGLAVVFGPKGPAALPPDPTVVGAEPLPDWFVRWYFALLYFKPGELETFVMVWMPLITFLALFFLPVFSPTGERSLARRPWAPVLVLFVLATFAVLTWVGMRVPWSPAYETRAFSAEDLGNPPAPVVRGAQVYRDRGCQYCHVVLDRGGRFGPNLTFVAGRMPPAHITSWIVEGYRDMPAYRDTLSEEELQAILTFLAALPELHAKVGAR